MRIGRVANFVSPRSGGIRTSLHALGAGYLTAGHEPVLVMPGERDSDRHTGQGRVITLRGPLVPSGGYRVLLLGQRRLAALLESLRRRRYASDGEHLLVHCGRLSPEKKPHRSLAAVAGLRAAGVRAVLVVAGDGPLRGRLTRQAARAGLPVCFTGFLSGRQALATLLASADVAVAPGPAETFGLAALACGAPVVASAAGAAAEVIGTAGVSVAGEDFAAGIAMVLARPEEARRAAARQRAEAFGWPAAVQGFLAVHQSARVLP